MKIDRQKLKKYMLKSNPNIAKIAREFGCHRNYVYYSIRKWGMTIKR